LGEGWGGAKRKESPFSKRTSVKLIAEGWWLSPPKPGATKIHKTTKVRSLPLGGGAGVGQREKKALFPNEHQ